MQLINLLDQNNRYIKALSTAAIVIGSIVAIGGGYAFSRSNFWHPKVTIVSVDFDNAICYLVINGIQKTLYGNSVLAAGGDWGVRFGTTNISGNEDYNTVELIKNDMVYDLFKVDPSNLPVAQAA